MPLTTADELVQEYFRNPLAFDWWMREFGETIVLVGQYVDRKECVQVMDLNTGWDSAIYAELES